ncbi:MAG: 50S ribosomal protein L24 [Gemmatimonadales bacterium]
MKPLVYRKSRKQTPGPAPRVRLRITKGDTVQVIAGNDRGKQGRVLKADPKSGRLTVEGINMVKRHRRATQNTEGGIIEFAAPIHHSNAMLVDPKSGDPTRVRRRRDDDGTVERISVKSGEPIPRNR